MSIFVGNPLTRMSVKQQLLLLFLILVSPVFILHWYGNAKAEDILKRHVSRAYAELNKQNQALIARDLETINQVTKTIIQNPLTQGMKPDPAATTSQLIRKYEEMEVLLASYSQGAGGEKVSYTYMSTILTAFTRLPRTVPGLPEGYIFTETGRNRNGSRRPSKSGERDICASWTTTGRSCTAPWPMFARSKARPETMW